MTDPQEILARALAELTHIQAIIDRGRPSRLTLLRLNLVCRKIQKLDATSKKSQSND